MSLLRAAKSSSEDEHNKSLHVMGGKYRLDKEEDATVIVNGRPKQNDGTGPQEAKGNEGESHGRNSRVEDTRDLNSNEIVDKFGPMSEDEIKKIREWLKLGN